MERKRRDRSASRSPARNRKERSPSPRTPRGEKDQSKRPREEIALDSPPRSDQKPKKDTEATPLKEWAIGAGRGKVTIEALRRQEEKIVPVILTGIEGAHPMALFRSVSNMLGKLSLDYEVFKDMKIQHERVILWVDNDRLVEVLPEGVYEERFKLTREETRDDQRPVHFKMKKHGYVDALRACGQLVPTSTKFKKAIPNVTVSIGVFLGQGGTQGTVLSILPPGDNAFISLWGMGYTENASDGSRVHMCMPQVGGGTWDSEVQDIVRTYFV